MNGSGEVMMLLRNGDSTLNLPEREFGQSVMEDMKQAMLQHELIFRNQVRDLHRLYWTQKNLMDKLRQSALDDHVPSCLSCVGMTQCKELLEEKNVCSSRSLTTEVWNSLAHSLGALEEIKGKSSEGFKINSTMLSLNLPADRFEKDLNYSHTGKEGAKGNGFIGVDEMGKHGSVLSKLTAEKDPRRSACFFGCEEVIDLESSIELECHEEANETQSGSFKCPTQESSVLGDSLSRRKRVGPLLIDLNAPHVDESTPDLDDSSENLEHEQRRCCSVQVSFALKPASSPNAAAKSSYENKADGFIYRCHGLINSKIALHAKRENCEFSSLANVKGVASVCQVRAECYDNVVEGSSDCSGEHSITTIPEFISSVNTSKQGEDEESQGKLSFTAHSDNKRLYSNITFCISTNLPQSEEDISSPAFCQDVVHCHSPSRFFLSECNFDGIATNNAYDSHDRSCRGPMTLSNSTDSVSTRLNSPKSKSFTEKSTTEDHDIAVAAAAKALMDFTLGWPAVPSVQTKIIQEAEAAYDNGSDEPQYSCDSFEYIALQQFEVQSADCIRMSEPPKVNETGNKESGIRLRRGRRLRDFQKEIMPGLVSLSRHEICEDLHNIGHKLRRTAARNARENWFVPVRQWRSVRRKRFVGGIMRDDARHSLPYSITGADTRI